MTKLRYIIPLFITIMIVTIGCYISYRAILSSSVDDLKNKLTIVSYIPFFNLEKYNENTVDDGIYVIFYQKDNIILSTLKEPITSFSDLEIVSKVPYSGLSEFNYYYEIRYENKDYYALEKPEGSFQQLILYSIVFYQILLYKTIFYVASFYIFVICIILYIYYRTVIHIESVEAHSSFLNTLFHSMNELIIVFNGQLEILNVNQNVSKQEINLRYLLSKFGNISLNDNMKCKTIQAYGIDETPLELVLCALHLDSPNKYVLIVRDKSVLVDEILKLKQSISITLDSLNIIGNSKK